MNRSISMLAGRNRKLDGGALFGTTPRRMWAEWMSSNHDNQVEVAARALLVQQSGQDETSSC